MSIMRLLQMKSRGGSPGAKMIVAAPALVEAYAVLTRLPPPHRLSSNGFDLAGKQLLKVGDRSRAEREIVRNFVAVCSKKQRGGWSHI
jgi:hypothetical protein